MDFKILLTIFLGITLLSNLALAIPTWPHMFFGSVTWNGSPAPDGTSVVAKINGIEVANTVTKDGKYGYEPLFFVPDTDPSSRPGSTINFFVNGIDTGKTAIFCNACWNDCGTSTVNCDSLDLSATGGEQPSPQPSPGGGGGGGGGGLYTPSTTTEEEEEETTEQVCQERWTCSEWGECENGIQRRTCTDQNDCGTKNNEPFLSQPCTTVGEEEEVTPEGEEGILGGPAGFFLGISTTNWIIGGVIGVIVAALIIFLVTRRKKR